MKIPAYIVYLEKLVPEPILIIYENKVKVHFHYETTLRYNVVRKDSMDCKIFYTLKEADVYCIENAKKVKTGCLIDLKNKKFNKVTIIKELDDLFYYFYEGKSFLNTLSIKSKDFKIVNSEEDAVDFLSNL